jgi:uncharacterized protein YyaL (SSP411 family)
LVIVPIIKISGGILKKDSQNIPNKLVNEKSPYLLQHAYNPVKWYPWGAEAFSKAEDEDKPIFLSIGYSTCHWCHVMEKESFEDLQVAKLLNDHFVCIKVDREERPDIDNMYMTVCQLMTGGGGWPLTIIMTPDKKPFFSGTYIPKNSRFGLVGMMELIPKIDEIWKKQRNEILSSSEKILRSLKQTSKGSNDKPLEESILQFAYGEYLNRFDENFGGFGTKPKFPSPHNLLFLMRLWKSKDYKKALGMVEKTLNSMRLGGIWDHVGGGFHRYSTDRFWRVPHFEKMLYDQAMIAMAYTDGYLALGKTEYKDSLFEILNYVKRDMTSSEGAFFSAEDADSEGEEGKFYLWTESEIRNALEDDAELILKVFNCSKEGNYTDEAKGTKTKKNILYLNKPLRDLAKDMDMNYEDLQKRISIAKQSLFKERRKRIPPQKDDKILSDLNGLMIAAFAKAGRAFDNSSFIETAERAMDFILNNMIFESGGLFHRYKDQEAEISGFLDDYAFVVWGLLELYESTFKSNYLKHAMELTKYSIEHLWDENGFGFFLASDETDELPVRQKTSYDGAVPSGNSVAMMNLLKISRITGSSEWGDLAFNIQMAFSKDINLHPTGHSMFLSAFNFAIGPTYEIVIVGGLENEDTKEILSKLRKIYLPNKVMVHKSSKDEIGDLIPYTKEMVTVDGKTTVYVCQDFACNLPTSDIEKMLELLGAK